MATSDWRGLYTVPEQNYGAQYTGRDDWIHPTNKNANKFYRHRAYRGGGSVDAKPRLTADYGVSRSMMDVELMDDPEMNVKAVKKYSTDDTYSEDLRKAGEIFGDLRGIAEDIQVRKR